MAASAQDRTSVDVGWAAVRQVAFYPPVRGGKYHAAWRIVGTAVCGSAIDLDVSDADAIRIGQGETRPHPILCRRCLNLTAKPGTSGQGVRQ